MTQKIIPAHAAQKLAELAPAIVRHVEEAVAAGRPADSTLASVFRAHREFGSRDRRFLSDLVFSFFRWRGWTRSMDMNSALILSHRLDAETIHPSIAILAGSLNLQPLADSSIEEKAAAAGGAIKDLVPGWFREVLYKPDLYFEKCLAAFQKRPPTWLRSGKGRRQELLHELESRGIPFQLHPTMHEAVAVQGVPPLSISHVEIQDIASQIVGHVCDPKAGESWWDACAGSGGKSLHLADLMNRHGRILATDIRESALAQLHLRAKRARVNILRTTRLPSSPEEWPQFQEEFDGILVDAPCSGIGTWSRNPDARWRTSLDEVRDRALLQADLLRKVAGRVRTGGRLVYSVCTVTTLETADVVDAFLRDRPDFSLDAPPQWIWPWDGPCDGMFVAKMSRSKDVTSATRG